MSIEIINGFRIRANINHFHQLMNDLQEVCEDLKQEDILRTIAKLITQDQNAKALNAINVKINSPLKNYYKDNFSPLRAAIYKMSDISEKLKTRPYLKNIKIHPELNYHFEITFFPYGEYIYLISTGEKRIFHEVIRTNKQFEEFDYSDTSPAPSHVPQELWEQRGKIWSILHGNANIKAKGYARVITEHDTAKYTLAIHPENIANILNRSYPLETRLKAALYAASKHLILEKDEIERYKGLLSEHLEEYFTVEYLNE